MIHVPTMAFQSTLPQGERRCTGTSPGLSASYFNPRSHKGSDDVCMVCTSADVDFNPRSHKGSDGLPLFILEVPYGISIHAPTRGATAPNTSVLLMDSISIHAPTRGATFPAGSFAPGSPISIHAPTRGATGIRFSTLKRAFISIHAPTRGATAKILIDHKIQELFQSTLPQGERPCSHRWGCRYTRFQSTLPQGERLVIDINTGGDVNFNPRSHKGSDSKRRLRMSI